MSLGDSALMEIQWIELAYNLSDTVPTVGEFMRPCTVDVVGATSPFHILVESIGQRIEVAKSSTLLLYICTMFSICGIL